MRARTIAVPVAAGAAVLGAAALAERRWRTTEDPCAGCELPEGRALKVDTDDGAVLDGVVLGDEAGGPAVVLSHCWTGSRAIWAPVAQRLADRGHTVVLYDQRGHGRSTGNVADIDVARLGTDLASVIEAADVTDAVVAGHSMGGMSVQALAAGHPDLVSERVRAIVLVATAASVAMAGRLGRLRSDLALRAVAAARVERAMGSRYGHALVRATVGQGPRHGQLVLTRDTFVATPPEVRRALLETMLRMDLRPGLADLALPATVVIGTRDTLTPPRLGRALADAIPGATTVEVPGAGHMLPLERPDLIADLIADHHAAA